MWVGYEQILNKEFGVLLSKSAGKSIYSYTHMKFRLSIFYFCYNHSWCYTCIIYQSFDIALQVNYPIPVVSVPERARNRPYFLNTWQVLTRDNQVRHFSSSSSPSSSSASSSPSSSSSSPPSSSSSSSFSSSYVPERVRNPQYSLNIWQVHTRDNQVIIHSQKGIIEWIRRFLTLTHVSIQHFFYLECMKKSLFIRRYEAIKCQHVW